MMNFLSEKSFLKIQTTFIELQENWQWENIKTLVAQSKQIDGVKKKQITSVEKYFKIVQENLKTTKNIAKFFVPSYFVNWFKEIENASKEILKNNLAGFSLQKYIFIQNEFITFLRIDQNLLVQVFCFAILLSEIGGLEYFLDSFFL